MMYLYYVDNYIAYAFSIIGIGAVLHLVMLLLWAVMVCSKFGQQL